MFTYNSQWNGEQPARLVELINEIIQKPSRGTEIMSTIAKTLHAGILIGIDGDGNTTVCGTTNIRFGGKQIAEIADWLLQEGFENSLNNMT